MKIYKFADPFTALRHKLRAIYVAMTRLAKSFILI